MEMAVVGRAHGGCKALFIVAFARKRVAGMVWAPQGGSVGNVPTMTCDAITSWVLFGVCDDDEEVALDHHSGFTSPHTPWS